MIEQAEGVLAQLHGSDMDAPFRALRADARSHGRTLRNVSEQVVQRTLRIERSGSS